MGILIEGKRIAEQIREDLAQRVMALQAKLGRPPGLGVVLVGDHPASRTYVRMKEQACQKAGIYSLEHHLSKDVTEQELLTLIHSLNSDRNIDGILVQLPLPVHIHTETVLAAVSPEKDVDGFHMVNMGKLLWGQPGFVPCTPKGILHLMDHANLTIAGKHAVIVGRSNIVGKPMACLLLSRHATVTICHSQTKNLSDITRQADILIAAVGRARLISGEMVQNGAVVIDVGINRLPDGRLVGDVDFESVWEKAAAITPVPGGVGPMTIAMLLSNTVTSAEQTLMPLSDPSLIDRESKEGTRS